MKIAIQGEPGSFSHQAALGSLANIAVTPCALSSDAFERLSEGAVDAILIPIENTLAGSVVEHYDLLREHPVHIELETVLRIEHHLIGTDGAAMKDIERIYSHPVALAQCRSFFQQHPQIAPVAFYDTAGAVKQIVELHDCRAAAIAGVQAAAIYGGHILERNVEDDAANFTRFLLVSDGLTTSGPEGQHKLSMCCQVMHRPGALATLLAEIGNSGGNLTQVQSRPVQGQPWHYYVFVDALMPDAGATDGMLERLGGMSAALKVLGRYQAAPEFQ